ncbi:MAG TPA: hypothetical protein IAB45_00270 [Candidatus Onthousia faecavium]|nr:hypothetical protein [Candidatus Onthousia faecavium]
MNVIIANEAKSLLSGLDIDVIKSVDGVHTADEIVEMFKNFFYARMILDITAIKDYQDITNIQKISIGLDADKIILLLPNTEASTSSSYLSKIISMGIYNFTTTLDGVKYFLEHPNSYKDVAHIQQLNDLSVTINDKVTTGSRIIGIKNITDHAGSTTLIYMLKKELEQSYGMSVVAIEVNRHDFLYFNSHNMISVNDENLMTEIVKHKEATIILIDLNDSDNEGVCGDVLYLIEPSSIKLNKLMTRNRRIFEELKGRKIILNKSLLSNSDIMDFEYEGRTKVFYNIPPLNDRIKNPVLSDFLNKIGLVNKPKEKDAGGKIFGLFKR